MECKATMLQIMLGDIIILKTQVLFVPKTQTTMS